MHSTKHGGLASQYDPCLEVSIINYVMFYVAPLAIFPPFPNDIDQNLLTWYPLCDCVVFPLYYVFCYLFCLDWFRLSLLLHWCKVIK